MELADIIIESLKYGGPMLMGLAIGSNIAEYEKTWKRFHKDVFRSKEYEEELKQKRHDNIYTMFNYYWFYPGRHYAYKQFDNPDNWGHRK